MNVKLRTKKQQSAQTRARLIRRARTLFAKRGYAATSTEKILKGLGITRGALYHQFADKRDLFRAVCEAIHKDLVLEIEKTAMSVPPEEALKAGCEAFLHATQRADVQQILILDGPAVLGWEEWNQLDREHGFGLLLEGVRETMASRSMPESEVTAFAIMLNGALNEAASWAARSKNPKKSLDAAKKVLGRFLR